MTTVSGLVGQQADAVFANLTASLFRLGGVQGFDGGAIAPWVQTYTTDGTGLLTMADLKPGKYRLTVAVPANPQTTQTVLIDAKGTIPSDAGSSLTLELFLDENAEFITPSDVQRAEAAATLSQAWAESPTAPGGAGTKSSKTWAGEAADSAALADSEGNATIALNAAAAAETARTGSETAETGAVTAQGLAEDARDLSETYAGIVSRATTVSGLTDPTTLTIGDFGYVSGSGDDAIDGLYEVQDDTGNVWVRVGDTGLAGKAGLDVASAAAQRKRFYETAQGFDFIAAETVGPYSLFSGGLGSTPTYSISGGVLSVNANVTGQNPRYWDTNQIRRSGEAMEITTEYVFSNFNSEFVGPMVALGGGGGIGFIFTHNGRLGIVNSTGSFFQETRGGIGFFDDVTFAVGDLAQLRVVLLPDGSGFMEGRNLTDGTEARHAFNGVVETGVIGPGQRRESAYEVRAFRLRVMPVSVGENLVASVLGLNALALRTTIQLPTPDSLSGRDPEGFTCTGVDKWDAGRLFNYRGVADDGRLVEGDASPQNSALHIITPTYRRVVKTLTFSPSNKGTQGFAIDRGLLPGSFWIGHGTNDNHIRHYEEFTGALDGTASAASQISADAIDWADGLELSSQVNGLAYDSDHGAALWATPFVGNYAVQIGVTSKTVLRTITLGISGASGGTSADQIQYLSRAQTKDGQARLIYTVGANGSNGTAWVYNLDTDEDAEWSVLPGSTAIEGCLYDPVTNTLAVTNNDGYHNAGTGPSDPAINNVKIYTMPPMPV